MQNAHDRHLDRLVQLARYIADHAEDDLPLARLAQRVNLSPSRMQRVFKSIFGVSPKKLQQAARSDRFKSLLRSGVDITEGHGSDDGAP